MNVATQYTFTKKRIDYARDSELDWMVGKRLGLPVFLMKPPGKEFGLPECFLKIKNDKGNDCFHSFNPTKDWRITGNILADNPICISQEKRPMSTNKDMEVSFTDNDGNEQKITSTYGLIQVICKAFVMYVGKEEFNKLIDEAQAKYDEIRGFKESR